jgi:hypothetical protein
MMDCDLMDRDLEIARILSAAYPPVGSTDPVSYVSEIGDSVSALAYSRLFWPNILEIEGAVFIALWGGWEKYVSERIRTPDPKRRSLMSWSEAVNSFNIFEIAHIFRQRNISWALSAEADYALAPFLVQTWSARLAMAYPKRTFKVRFSLADGVMDSRIEVSQENPRLMVPAGWSNSRHAIVD